MQGSELAAAVPNGLRALLSDYRRTNEVMPLLL